MKENKDEISAHCACKGVQKADLTAKAQMLQIYSELFGIFYRGAQNEGCHSRHGIDGVKDT